MKYELDTIPVWDALRAETECALCLLERRSRNNALRYFLGPAVMAPEVRVQTNQRGFAPHNLRLLAKDQNKLGLALLAHTRLKTLRAHLAARSAKLENLASKVSTKTGPGAAWASKPVVATQAREFANYLRQQEKDCLIDEKVGHDLERYCYTVLQLWKEDPDFRRTWEAGKGLCLHHMPSVLEMAAAVLDARRLGEFLVGFLALQNTNLARVENDLLGFTQTFDSTHSREITGNTVSALNRALQKTSGEFQEYQEESKARRGPLLGAH